jgi:hypothetical protein
VIELSGSQEIIRMPLHAEAERAAGTIDGFDHAVGRRRRRGKAFVERLHGLAVAAVELAAVGGAKAIAQ